MEAVVKIGENVFYRFDVLSGDDRRVPDTPGAYVVVLREGASLPPIEIQPVFSQLAGLDVIYVGQSKDSLRKRDVNQHFNGSAGRSTLRKSLGSLMGFEKIARDINNPNNGKTTFCASDEDKLSTWMNQNLILYYCTTLDVTAVEEDLIARFNPPLNLMKNSNKVNVEYRKALSLLRKQR